LTGTQTERLSKAIRDGLTKRMHQIARPTTRHHQPPIDRGPNRQEVDEVFNFR